MSNWPNEKRNGAANEVQIQTRSIALGSDHDQARRIPPFPPYRQIGRGQYHPDLQGPETETSTIPPSKIIPHCLRMAGQASSKEEDGLDHRHHRIVPSLQVEGVRKPRLEMKIATHVGGTVRSVPMNVVGSTMPGLHAMIDARGAGVWIAVA